MDRDSQETKPERRQIFKIYAIVEKPGNQKDVWLDIGVGSRNRDGSITCKLDCLPTNGLLQVRLHEPRSSQKNGKLKRNDNNPPQRQWQEGGF